jgi:1-deoxy-D-xylulose-5-phosphate synthase
LADGDDLLIIALGHMNDTALKVSALLAEEGISVAVMDPVFVKPLDSELLCQLLLKHKRLVTLEEHSAVSGLGSVVNNFLMSQGYSSIEMLNLGIPETFVEHGSYQDLLNELGLTPEKIVGRIKGHFIFSEGHQQQSCYKEPFSQR